MVSLKCEAVFDQQYGLYAYVIHHPTEEGRVVFRSAAGFDPAAAAEAMAAAWAVAATEACAAGSAGATDEDEPAAPGGHEVRVVFDGCGLLWPGRWEAADRLARAFRRSVAGAVEACGASGPENAAWVVCRVSDLERGLTVIRGALAGVDSPSPLRLVSESEQTVPAPTQDAEPATATDHGGK